MTNSPQPRFDATRAPGAILVEHCDIPDGMTISEWRTACAAERRADREAGVAGRGFLRRALRRR